MKTKLEDLIVYECEEYLDMIMICVMSGERSVQRVAREDYEAYKKRHDNENTK